MGIVLSLDGESELNDTLMRAILGGDTRWKPGHDDYYAYHFVAENELLGVAANPYESPDFAFELPYTPIIDRAHVSFFIAGSPYLEALHAVIQCVGRALRATDAAHGAMPDPRKWSPDPHSTNKPPAFSYGRRDGLLTARGRQRNEEYEPQPAHELRAPPIRERVSLDFDFEDSENLERARFEALKCALRVIAVAQGDLLVRYRDLILMARRGSELTLYHTLPENAFWDRPGHLE